MSKLILNESTETILSTSLLARNKLKNMKNQLENLLSKKIRIESEISILKKSIRKKEKYFQMKIKSSINLEAFNLTEGSGGLSPEGEKFVRTNLPEENIQVLREIDSISRELEEIFSELEE